MSNPPNNDMRRLNHLQSDPITGIFTPQQLGQFAAAGAGGYVPPAYSNPSEFVTNSDSNSSNRTQPSATASITATPMSDFARDAYESAKKGNPIERRPPPNQPIDLTKFNGCKFVTLDPFIIELGSAYDQVSGTYMWEMCQDREDRCINFCKENSMKRIFLVTCGSLGLKVVPQIHDLPQVYAIYVHCSDVPGHMKWTNQYSKVRVVCDNDDRDLIPQLAVDVAQTNIEWGDALMSNGERDKAVKKYEKAMENLNKFHDKVDPNMITKVQEKLAKCK